MTQFGYLFWRPILLVALQCFANLLTAHSIQL